jgi:acylphosphatase
MKRLHFWVTGRVQGVFYRQSAREKAGQLGLSGWVRNLGDGRVEGVAEGGEAALEDWLAWLRQGPPAARVDDVAVSWESPQGESGFHIAPTL